MQVEGAVECSRGTGAFVQQNLGVTFLVLWDGFVRTVQHVCGFRTALLTGYDAICWFFSENCRFIADRV